MYILTENAVVQVYTETLAFIKHKADWPIILLMRQLIGCS